MRYWVLFAAFLITFPAVFFTDVTPAYAVWDDDDDDDDDDDEDSDKAGMLFSIGLGPSVPIGKSVSSVASTGVHVDGGGYLEVASSLFAGLHVSFDLPTGVPRADLPGPSITMADGEAQFTGITLRGMFLADMERVKPWISLGIGLFRNKVTRCVPACKVDEQSQAGLDLSAGLDIPVHEEVTLGPAIGVTATALAEFMDQLLFNAALRITFNL